MLIELLLNIEHKRLNKTELCVMKGIIAIRNKSIINNIANKGFELGVFIRCLIFTH